MKGIHWKALKPFVPEKYKRAIDIAYNIDKLIKKISQGANAELFLNEDLIQLKQEGKRLMSFCVEIASSEPDAGGKLKANLKNLIEVIMESESTRELKDRGFRAIGRKNIIMYLSDYQDFLGIFYDTIIDAIRETQKQFDDNFIKIITKRSDLYTKHEIRTTYA